MNASSSFDIRTIGAITIGDKSSPIIGFKALCDGSVYEIYTPNDTYIWKHQDGFYRLFSELDMRYKYGYFVIRIPENVSALICGFGILSCTHEKVKNPCNITYRYITKKELFADV